ncbi:hypothetical protein VPEG_00058 [Vibrio phage SIO-2]|uniref:hypothetical protein n=1 Tax=Vibrio phage SIO-2 TaxID=700512 RepID=UPI0002357C60|nr:hypothetical protein VPEG_00058 [Vibrio phage SIO-2]AET42209.1 hypothetical protein VPEG_00058 [Vibrio phage SIO-2]
MTDSLDYTLFGLGERLAAVYFESIAAFADELGEFVEAEDLIGLRAHIDDLTLEPLYEANRDVILDYHLHSLYEGARTLSRNPSTIIEGLVPEIVTKATDQTGLMLIDSAKTIKGFLFDQVNDLEQALTNAQKAEVDPKQRILTQFKDNLKNTARGRGSNLVDLVSSLNSTRLMSYGFFNECALVGIKKYRFNALKDVRTTEFCDHLHNKVFEITTQLERLDTELRINDSDQIREFAAFPRWDQIDEFKAMTNEQLIARGWCYPPLHFYCRSTIEYVSGTIQAAGLEIPTAEQGLQEVLSPDEIRAMLNMIGITNSTINLTSAALSIGTSALSIMVQIGISAESLSLINAAIQSGLLE